MITVPRRRVVITLVGLCVVVVLATVVALNTVLAQKVVVSWAPQPARQVSGWTGIDLAPAQLTSESIGNPGPVVEASRSIFLESIANFDTNKPITGISCNSHDQLLLPAGHYELKFFGADLLLDSSVDVQVVKGYHAEVGRAQFSYPDVGVLNQGNPPSAAICGLFPSQSQTPHTYPTPTSTP